MREAASGNRTSDLRITSAIWARAASGDPGPEQAIRFSTTLAGSASARTDCGLAADRAAADLVEPEGGSRLNEAVWSDVPPHGPDGHMINSRSLLYRIRNHLRIQGVVVP